MHTNFRPVVVELSIVSMVRASHPRSVLCMVRWPMPQPSGAVMDILVNNGRANVRAGFSALFLHCGSRLYACAGQPRRWVRKGRVTEAGLKLEPHVLETWNGPETADFACFV